MLVVARDVSVHCASVVQLLLCDSVAPIRGSWFSFHQLAMFIIKKIISKILPKSQVHIRTINFCKKECPKGYANNVGR